jgi:hypothetical protein
MQGFVLHTGEPLPIIDAAWLTDSGQLVLQGTDKVALVSDRDMAQCVAQLRMDGSTVGDEQLLGWLANQAADLGRLSLCLADRQLPMQRIEQDEIAAHFGFVLRPRPDNI